MTGAGETDRVVVRRVPVFRVAVLRAAGLRPAVFAAALRVPRLAAVFRVAVDAVDFRVVLFLLGARRPRFAALGAGAGGAGLLEPARWRSTFETWVSRLASWRSRARIAARSSVTGFCGVAAFGLRVEVVLLRAIDRVA